MYHENFLVIGGIEFKGLDITVGLLNITEICQAIALIF